ncbi:zinc-binding dehydrogenase [Vibrio alginolyticus]|uniref:zinc-binding dehydrogenase n=1 Tax=Vibrio sp. B1FLJ16 TaxID=2751178 RepID=UPI0015F38CCC|nr:zinc-binding dehydrogenase [Vibrio sp. B1FLJ16]CAD7821591.1 Alcohol dehydrogenase GroES-like domain [Vibrio sp. B1FLJ16]CAE6946679.1 Alcohol dehydrogenase GroES-like domain [Vibrio sp. B1FLJ16]
MTTMNSIVMQDGSVHLQQVNVPKPAPGQVLVRSLACGICGSDLHIARHTEEVFDVYRKLGVMTDTMDDHTEVMLGHEFCAEIVEYGDDTQQALPVGSRVTSVPVLMSQNGAGVGVTPGIHGAYSEYFLLDEALLLPVPENVPSEAAALTEPLAVGLHAVNRSDIRADEVALVVGCGPIGLATITALHQRGVTNILAVDIQDEKLELAKEFGATRVVNPTREDEVAVGAEVATGSRLVIFECVGKHTLIDDFIRRAPAGARIVVTGIHTTPTEINYAYATVKELDLRFSYYYQPHEFEQCLQAIAEGKVPWQKMLTAKVGMDGVESAFKQLMTPNDHIKVVIEPWRNGELEVV